MGVGRRIVERTMQGHGQGDADDAGHAPTLPSVAPLVHFAPLETAQGPRRTMKSGIHPEYRDLKATCSCGNVIETRSTLGGSIHIDVCSACHPFFLHRQAEDRRLPGPGGALPPPLRRPRGFQLAKKARCGCGQPLHLSASDALAYAGASTRCAAFDKSCPSLPRRRVRRPARLAVWRTRSGCANRGGLRFPKGLEAFFRSSPCHC